MPNDGYNFNQATYETTPGHEISGNVPLTHDAARAIMGDGWRMPTVAETTELIENTTQEWEVIDGLKYMVCTSVANGRKLYIPLAGYCRNENYLGAGTAGDYWTSSVQSLNNGHYMYATVSSVDPAHAITKTYGFTIRAVRDP